MVMKKTVLLTILFLSSCVSKLSDNRAYQPSFEAFEVSDKCPSICWLGINPGTTSIDEAISIVMGSNKINRDEFLQITNTSLQSVWAYTDTSGVYKSNISLIFSNGVVESIYFNTLTPFTLSDFVRLLGEPDIIIIELDKTVDSGDLVHYAVYFSLSRTSLSVYPGSWNGPNPHDYISTLVLNAEFTHPEFFFIQEKQQPWIGYERLQEYLPDQELPLGTYTPPETGP